MEVSTMGAHSYSPEPILELAERVIAAESLEELAASALPVIAALTPAQQAFLYVVAAPALYPHGFSPGVDLDKRCAQIAVDLSGQPETHTVPAVCAAPAVEMSVSALRVKGRLVGLLGLAAPEPPPKLLSVLAHAVHRLTEEAKAARQFAYLNTYQTVSSMLAQSLGMEETMETILYCCMEAVSAEAASILLLDDGKQNFYFYQVEGAAKPTLLAATMPAHKGLAGSVLQNEQPEVINDVQNDSRFYREFDAKTEFETRNMIAVPLVAGQEKIGVLEVLNKTDGQPFTEKERLMLMMIAEEIAFGIRNARMFEVVVKSYCKQRQGLNSCHGCQRPLGSWTPCVKYRATGTWSIVIPHDME
jgi:GAF domain-containing protein